MATKKATNKRNPALLAVDAVGGRGVLANKLTPPISRQAIDRWVNNGRIPIKRVVEVSRLTKIPKEVLSPYFAEK